MTNSRRKLLTFLEIIRKYAILSADHKTCKTRKPAGKAEGHGEINIQWRVQMHKIDKEIIDALNRLIESCGSALEVERRTGVTNSTISKYRSGKIPRMNDSTWAALEPYLRPFLKQTGLSPSAMEISPDGQSEKTEFPPAYLNLLIRRIVTCPDLSEAERIKFIRILLNDFVKE